MSMSIRGCVEIPASGTLRRAISHLVIALLSWEYPGRERSSGSTRRNSQVARLPFAVSETHGYVMLVCLNPTSKRFIKTSKPFTERSNSVVPPAWAWLHLQWMSVMMIRRCSRQLMNDKQTRRLFVLDEERHPVMNPLHVHDRLTWPSAWKHIPSQNIIGSTTHGYWLPVFLRRTQNCFVTTYSTIPCPR